MPPDCSSPVLLLCSTSQVTKLVEKQVFIFLNGVTILLDKVYLLKSPTLVSPDNPGNDE